MEMEKSEIRFLPSKLCEEERDSSLLADLRVPVSPLPPVKMNQISMTTFDFYPAAYICLHYCSKVWGQYKKNKNNSGCIDKTDSIDIYNFSKDFYFK